MNRPISTSFAESYSALTVVSPMMDGDEKKDQDRARWYGPDQVACVCDGVTSSPNSTDAAILATLFAPALFNGDCKNRLGMLSDLLMARRRECQASDISFDDDTSPAMRDMLRRVAKQKRAISFQTTLVAARFVNRKKVVLAQVCKCGDSAFFAFSPQGQLLTSSLAFPSNLRDQKEYTSSTCSDSRSISFGPGDEILVRIEGQLSQYHSLAEQAQIKSEHARKWVVCVPIDGCCDSEQVGDENLLDIQTLSLKSTDRLLVPKYLYGTQLTSQGRHYRVLRYSSTIRPVRLMEAPISISGFNKHGSTTMVLPDHYYCGGFDSFQDRFPSQTHFVLCSDGFYSSFSDWQGLWTWLRQNAAGLNDQSQREAILRRLHCDLHAKCSDDDISFIWVRPSDSGLDEPEGIVTQSKTKGGDTSCPQGS